MASRLRHIFEFDGFPLICVVSLLHREIAIASPLRDPLNDPEASMSTESAPVCTHCTRKMLGTTFVSHTEPYRQNREKQENHVIPTASHI